MPPKLPPRLHLQLLRRAVAEQLAMIVEIRRRAEAQRADVARMRRAAERMSDEMWAGLVRARRIRLWWE